MVNLQRDSIHIPSGGMVYIESFHFGNTGTFPGVPGRTKIETFDNFEIVRQLLRGERSIFANLRLDHAVRELRLAP